MALCSGKNFLSCIKSSSLGPAEAPKSIGVRNSCIAAPNRVGCGRTLTWNMSRTLLVVDDNRSVRESLKFLLLRRGYEVFVAENGPEAIAIAQKQLIDGALVDVNMPGMNGIEVCRLLREHAAASGRPIAVWMMTGARTPEVLKMAKEAGALDLLGKPFDLHALYRRFEEQFALGGGESKPQA